MHGAVALGALALGRGGHGGDAVVGMLAGSVDIEIVVPQPVPPVVQEGPAVLPPTQVATPFVRAAPIANAGQGLAGPLPPSSDVGPALTADPAPTAPHFTIAWSPTASAPHGTGDTTSVGQVVAPPIVEASHVTIPAKLQHSVTPSYPVNAREQGVEADAKVEIVVDETGRVIESRSLTSAGYGFDEAALAALRDYRFSPARVGDQIVRVRMPWSVEFRLR